jgi:hypothetical protein
MAPGRAVSPSSPGGTLGPTMGLQQFERRLERMVEGVFARAFRGGLQPVEIGRRMTREMDLRRTVAPKGTLAPNSFTVVLSPSDYGRFTAIEDELIKELIDVAKDHADVERYSFLGPVTVTMETDDALRPGMVLVAGEMVQAEAPLRARLVLPDGAVRDLGGRRFTIGRLPDCSLVLADPNVSRYHAELEPLDGSGADQSDYTVADMGSTNGTKLNGSPLVGVQRLRDGDQIMVGSTAIRFERY